MVNRVTCGDSADVLKKIKDCSIDVCVTDPPYGLGGTDGAADRCEKVLLKIGFPQFTDPIPSSDDGLATGLVPFNSGEPLLAASAPCRDTGIYVAPVTVDLHDKVQVGDVEVAGHPAPSVSVIDGELPDVCEAEGSQCLGYFVLETGILSSESGGSHTQDGILAELSQGLLGVAVRLRDYALAEAEGSTSVVALAGAELRAVLRFDLDRVTSELLPTDSASEPSSCSFRRSPRLVRARAAAGGLPSVLQAVRVGVVLNSADGACSRHLHLLAPPDVFKSLRPIVPQKGFMGQTWDATTPSRAIWADVLRVLKPGASCFVCAGARQDTLLGMLTDLREVGFEIEHSALTWCFANGAMPKSLNLSKSADVAAFTAWCKEIPDGETESRADLMGWSAADLRKAASAAVNGEAPPTYHRSNDSVLRGDRSVSEAGMYQQPDEILRRHSRGAALLTALVSRFGPAPGVRASLGNKPPDGTRDAPEQATAPATPEAQQLDGWHGGKVPLKPMSEVVLWVTKPMDRKPIRANVKAWGVGGVNVEACRVPFEDGEESVPINKLEQWSGLGQLKRPDYEATQNTAGRYPSNLLITARALGDFSRFCSLDAWAAANGLDAEWLDAALQGIVRVPKPSRTEKTCSGTVQNWHSTVKPVTLMAYLIALACPRGGIVLDPFLGSGTTAVAASTLGMHFVGIELNPNYCKIAEARVSAALDVSL